MPSTRAGRETAARPTSEAEPAERIALALEAAGSGLFECDLASGALYLSPHLKEILGYGPLEEVPHDAPSLLGLVHPDERSRAEWAWRALQERAIPLRVEVRIRRGAGPYRWVEVRAAVERGTDGRARRIGGLVADVTADRLGAVQQLQSEERFRLIAEHSHDLIGLFDLDGRFRYASPAYRQRLGYDPSLLEGRVATELLVAEDHPHFFSAFTRALVLGHDAATLRFRHAHGAVRTVETTLALAPSVSGDAVVVVGRDITERRDLEAQLRHAQRMSTLGALAAGIVHDFNNVVSVIAALSVSGPGEEATQERFDEISVAADRAAVLSRQLLGFIRQGSASVELLDPGQLVTDLRRVLEVVCGPAIALECVSEGPLPHVVADPGQMAQVLLNLVVNARDAMQEGGRLTISVRGLASADALAGREGVELVVRDTGCGMTPEVAARVGEPYFTTKPEGQGNGLGLATVYSIVREAGGTVSVQTAPGEGAAFTITLPAAGS